MQETRWKRSQAGVEASTGGGFKLFYHGIARKRNGAGVILKEENVNCVGEEEVGE